MRVLYGFTFAVAVAVLAPNLNAQMQEVGKAVAGGGIKVSGWQAKVDDNEAKAGLTVDSAKFEPVTGGFHVVTGPAITYWNPANKAAGNYTVKATFVEKEYMNLNDHPHPYGIVIAGNELGTPNASLLYCSAYGNGTFIVRGFTPTPPGTFGLARRAEKNPAVNVAAGKGQPVTQEIALSVKGDKIECAVNGTVVGSYDKASAIGDGKLKSTDGVYGLRFGHNTEVTVTGFGMTKG